MAPRRRRAVEEDEDEVQEISEDEQPLRKKDKGKGKPKNAARPASDVDEMEVDSPRATGAKKRGRGASEEDEEPERVNPQQLSASEKYAMTLPSENLERMIKDTVRLAIYMQNQNKPIQKDQIKTLILKEHGRANDYVVEKAREFLKGIFGMDMELLPVKKRKPTAADKKDGKETAGRSYGLKSVLKPEWTAQVVERTPQKVLMGFASIVLFLIYVNGGPVKGSLSESTLKRRVEKLGTVDPEKMLKEIHDERYVDTQKIAGPDGAMETFYSWGNRAKIEFPEDSIVGNMASYYPNPDDETLRKNIKKSARIEVAPQATQA